MGVEKPWLEDITKHSDKSHVIPSLHHCKWPSQPALSPAHNNELLHLSALFAAAEKNKENIIKLECGYNISEYVLTNITSGVCFH